MCKGSKPLSQAASNQRHRRGSSPKYSKKQRAIERTVLRRAPCFSRRWSEAKTASAKVSIQGTPGCCVSRYALERCWRYVQLAQ